jgi:AcrR family transcriptional regulator
MSISVTSEQDPLRERILQAAARLFGEQGVDSTSMREIADSLGITKAAIYYHFENKDHLHHEIHLRLIEDVLERMHATTESERSATEKIEQIVADNLDAIARNRDAFAVLLREGGSLDLTHWSDLAKRRDGYRHYVEAVIQQGVEDGEFEVHDIQVAALALLGMCDWSYTWISPSGPSSIAEIARQFTEVFISGVRAPH